MTASGSARYTVLFCIASTIGAAPPPGESIASINVVDRLTKSIGGEPHAVVERFVITPIGKGFVRVDLKDNSVHRLAPGVVGNFLRTLKAWRYQAPSAKALWLSPIQAETLEGNLQKRCGYGNSLETALSAYYGEKINLASDYSEVEITVDYGEGKTIAISSHNWQLYGLPWKMRAANGRESLSFDSEISRAIAPMLGSNAVNAARLTGVGTAGDDALSDIAAVACERSKKSR